MEAPILVHLDDMRGDIDQIVEVTRSEWASLARSAGVRASSKEIDASNLDDTDLFDELLDRPDVSGEATHTIWIP
jgi:hypothetical protein